MRYGLLALSIAMLTSGALAAHSALAISQSATSVVASAPLPGGKNSGTVYGSVPFTAARAETMRVATR